MFSVPSKTEKKALFSLFSEHMKRMMSVGWEADFVCGVLLVQKETLTCALLESCRYDEIATTNSLTCNDDMIFAHSLISVTATTTEMFNWQRRFQQRRVLFTKDVKIQIPFLCSLQRSAVDKFSDYWSCQDLVFCIIKTFLHLPSAETICGLKTRQPGQRVWWWLIVCCDTVITLTHSSAKNAYSLSNSRFGAVTVKSSCHGEMYFFCKHSCRLNTHLPRHPLLQGYVYCLRNRWIRAFACKPWRGPVMSQVWLLLKKKSGVRTQSRLGVAFCRWEVRTPTVTTVSPRCSFIKHPIKLFRWRPPLLHCLYICAIQTANPWLQSVTAAWLKFSLLTSCGAAIHLYQQWSRERRTQVSHRSDPWRPVG